jgi:hypothetical protein
MTQVASSLRSPARIDLGVLQESSVHALAGRELYPIKQPEGTFLLRRTVDEGSVFDLAPFFRIPGSGRRRTQLSYYVDRALRDPSSWKSLERSAFEDCFSNPVHVTGLLEHAMFRELRLHGARTDCVGSVDPGTGDVRPNPELRDVFDLALTEAYPVVRPSRFSFLGHGSWDYSSYFACQDKMMALEHIFRLGIPGGSSVLTRYRDLLESDGEPAATAFRERWGLPSPPTAWHTFENLTYDCTSKYEDCERYLDWQETVHLSGVDHHVFAQSVLLLMYATVLTRHLLARMGLQVWDLRWSVAIVDGQPIIVDAIDHDSVCLTAVHTAKHRHCHFHFNKHAISDFYRLLHPDWVHALEVAKSQAARDPLCRPFMEIYHEGVQRKELPGIPALPPEFLQLLAEKYDYTTHCLESGGDRDANMISAIAEKEVAFYRDAGVLEDFISLSSAMW